MVAASAAAAAAASFRGMSYRVSQFCVDTSTRVMSFLIIVYCTRNEDLRGAGSR